MKAAGVVVDDTAVTPAYVHGLAAERELSIIKRIAVGSLRNKVLIILPVALLLSTVVPVLVEVILMFGGTFLAYEGAHKLHARFGHHHEPDEGVPAVAVDPEHESTLIAGAIRTDFILSAEIMVIALKEVLDEPILNRAIILVIVALLITVAVYGVVAMIVKMDDVGLRLTTSASTGVQRIGHRLVTGMPKLLAVLSAVGTAAMLWVGGHILIAGAHELGWDAPYDLVHHLEERVHEVPVVGGVRAWLVNTAISALVGLAVGLIVVAVVSRLPKRKGKAAAAH